MKTAKKPVRRIKLPRSVPPPREVFNSGPFAGVDVHDTFARAALRETTVVVSPGAIVWPNNLAPTVKSLGGYTPGQPITGPLKANADALILLYTDPETSALLDVFTGNNSWTPGRKRTWYPYAHNFAKFKGSIQSVAGDDALQSGIFGYLYAMSIGNKNVVLYKTELHPKTNGRKIPFIPVIQQLVTELAPKLVISTGTAGAIGKNVNCGDVAITSAARFHVREKYASFPDLNTMTQNQTQLTNTVALNSTYLDYAAANFTKLSLPGLAKCYTEIQTEPGYAFLKKNTQPPAIHTTNLNPVAGPQPMDVVSSDYLTVDDNNDSEDLQSLGIMNDNDDAFAFYAISKLPAAKQPKWLSVRNASEPQIVAAPFPANATPTQIINKLKGIAGAIYGIYQYCTTINSAFACWGVVAGMQ